MSETKKTGLRTRISNIVTGVFRQKPTRKKPKLKAEQKQSTLVTWSHYAFSATGGRMQFLANYFQDLRPKLIKAGMKITLRAYISLVISFSAIAFIIPLASSLVLGIVFRAAFTGILLLGLALGLLCFSFTFIALYTYPSIKSDSRGRRIDEELPYVASHMAVLATAGVAPERIFRSVAVADGALVAEEMTDVVRDVDLLGKDIISALRSASDHSSSKEFSEMSEGLISTVASGGDMRKYLYDKAKSLMELKKIRARELGDTLSIVGEAYVTLLVVFPLVVMIMFTVMASISSTLGGFSILMLMYLLAYVLVPLMAAAVIVLLDAMIPSW